MSKIQAMNIMKVHGCSRIPLFTRKSPSRFVINSGRLVITSNNSRGIFELYTDSDIILYYDKEFDVISPTSCDLVRYDDFLIDGVKFYLNGRYMMIPAEILLKLSYIYLVGTKIGMSASSDSIQPMIRLYGNIDECVVAKNDTAIIEEYIERALIW